MWELAHHDTASFSPVDFIRFAFKIHSEADIEKAKPLAQANLAEVGNFWLIIGSFVTLVSTLDPSSDFVCPSFQECTAV